MNTKPQRTVARLVFVPVTSGARRAIDLQTGAVALREALAAQKRISRAKVHSYDLVRRAALSEAITAIRAEAQQAEDEYLQVVQALRPQLLPEMLTHFAPLREKAKV